MKVASVVTPSCIAVYR